MEMEVRILKLLEQSDTLIKEINNFVNQYKSIPSQSSNQNSLKKDASIRQGCR